MEIIKAVIFLASSVLMGLVIFFAPNVSGGVCVFYAMILSGYLGLDVWSMINKTLSMPEGEYKSIKAGRYVLCVCCYMALAVCAYIESARSGIDLSTLFNVLLSAVFVMVAILLAGLEGNKIAMNYKAAENNSINDR